MATRFSSHQERDEFLAQPRLAILMYHGSRPGPTGVPVWFDWTGEALKMFAARGSAKVKKLKQNPNSSVLVTNRVGEPEGWVAFDGEIKISDFALKDWQQLIDRVAPRYWDMTNEQYANEIASWRSSPESFVSLTLTPDEIRSGA